MVPTELHLPYTPPFDFKKCCDALYRSPDEILYQVEDNKVYRLVQIQDEFIPIVISDKNGSLKVETDRTLDSRQQNEINDFVTTWFDLNKQLSPFYELLKKNPKLSHLSEKLHGLRIVGIPDLFEAICWSIIGQQINLNFAHKLKRRLIEIYGHKVNWRGYELHHFPSPEALLELDEVYLHQEKQFSRSKLKYLKNVAEAFSSGHISREKLQELSSFEERQSLLTSIKGIGVWSANYSLMKALNQAEAIPFGDTGLTQALFNLGIIEHRKDEDAIRDFFKTVPGWEAYTVFYLWRSL